MGLVWVPLNYSNEYTCNYEIAKLETMGYRQIADTEHPFSEGSQAARQGWLQYSSCLQCFSDKAKGFE